MDLATRNEIERVRDELILLQCRRGDEAGFRELVSCWERPLFYYLRRFFDREEDAWDALQEVWMRAFKGIRSLREVGAFRAWLYRIAHNTAMSHLRADPRWESLDEEEHDQTCDPGWIAVSTIPDGYAACDLHWALGQIPLPEREVLTLYYLEGFDLEEMAGIAGVPSGTLKSRMHRARRHLRSVLEKEAERS